MIKPEIIVCDQTIREGMQYRGVVFTHAERRRILAFQESLGVDISQVAYPSAHRTERDALQSLLDEGRKKKFRIRIAGLGRALTEDAAQMVQAGAGEFHLHLAVEKGKTGDPDPSSFLVPLHGAVDHIRTAVRDASITVNILDIGRADIRRLREIVRYISRDLAVDAVVLPDTSGILAPNVLYERIREMVDIVRRTDTRIGVHCHNDMGMATANTVMGAVAGASVIEVSALGIGERNGIGDLYLVASALQNQGCRMNLDTRNTDLFHEYYAFVDRLVKEKTGSGILGYNTPFWGEAMQTHVAGSHGLRPYGLRRDSRWLVNVLCGKHLVRKFLHANRISFPDEKLPQLVEEIKNRSAMLGRSLGRKDVMEIIHDTFQMTID